MSSMRRIRFFFFFFFFFFFTRASMARSVHIQAILREVQRESNT